MSSEPEKMELQEEKVESPTSTKEDEDLEEVRMEEAPGEPIEVQHTEETKHPTTPVGVAGYHLDIDNRVLPYVGMIVAAVVLLVAILVPDYDLENKNYTISVCAIVFAFGFAGMFVATSVSTCALLCGLHFVFKQCVFSHIVIGHAFVI